MMGFFPFVEILYFSLEMEVREFDTVYCVLKTIFMSSL